MNKEQVYDEKISPLMTQIIDICHEHNIGMIADFEIPTTKTRTCAAHLPRPATVTRFRVGTRGRAQC